MKKKIKLKNIKDDSGYIAGLRDAKDIIRFISNTDYQTVEGAVIAKQALVDNFETTFGYVQDIPETDTFDKNYSRAVGTLVALKEHLKTQENVTTTD